VGFECRLPFGGRSFSGFASGVVALWIVALVPLLASAAAPATSIRVLLLERVSSVAVDGKVRRAPVRFAAPGPHEVDGRRVRGSVEVLRQAGGLIVVNELPLEDYVAGTLLGEVSEGFGDAVLRAQAVAIRTYALHRRAAPRSPNYDVEAGTRSQVYLGLAGESRAAREAVDATRGEILTFEGEPILAAFHSAAGGRTATAAEVWGRKVPYLVSVGVPGEEDSPDTYWRAPFSAGELGEAFAAAGRKLGTVRDIAIAERTPSGRSAVVRVRGTRGTQTLSGEALRRVLGLTRLRSTLFEVRRTADGFVFVGSGNGHGVGMSQWGARALAQRGANYEQILARFYPGARIEKIASRSASVRGAASALAARTTVDAGVSR
jgi:stage II sporulation protein D